MRPRPNPLAIRVATVLTACGIETGDDEAHRMDEDFVSCNSTYRLRY